MNLWDFSIKRPVALSMTVVGILLLGFVSLEKIPLNLLPDITYPKITIRTEYPHAAPREVEERVTKFIESAVGIIQNVVKVSSVSRPGWSDVYVEFQWGSDVDVIAMDIREKLQLLEGVLPEEVGRPVLLRYDPNQDPIMTLAVGGEGDLSEVRRWVEMNMELELERLDGVAAVKVEGGFENEIVVDLDEQLLRRYGLSIATISDRLRRENLNLASGTLTEGGTKLAVRTVNRFANLSDLENVILAEKGGAAATPLSGAAVTGLPSSLTSLGGGGMGGLMGAIGGLSSLLSGLGANLNLPAAASTTSPSGPAAVIRVKDVGKVSFQHKERTEIARLNNRECIKVSIYKEGDANIVTVAKNVQKAIQAIKANHRRESRSPEWDRKLKSPVRRLQTWANSFFNLLLSWQPFPIPEEPIPLERDIKIGVISDQSVFILQSIFSVAQNAIWGSIFAVFVLYLFLRNLSSTVIVGLAIPISIITTFNLMFFRGITFNIMSLGGLALGVGMLVDNNIVVIENILRHRTFERDLIVSAQRGAAEVAMPVTSGTLTNIIVFLPILYLEGMFRQFFSDLAWTVAFSTLCSLIVSITILPMMCVLLGKWVKLPSDLLYELDPSKITEPMKEETSTRDTAKAAGLGETLIKHYSKLKFPGFSSFGRLLKWIGYALGWGIIIVPFFTLIFIVKRLTGAVIAVVNYILKYPLLIFDLGFGRIRRGYPVLLRKFLKHPYLVSLGSVGVAIFSLGVIYILGWELLPTVDQSEFFVRVELPSGTPIEETNRRVARLEQEIRGIPDGDKLITSLFATVGIGTAEGEGMSDKAENIGEVHVSLVFLSGRQESDEQIISRAMRAIGNEVELSARSSKPRLFSYKAPIEIEIEGDNLDELKTAAEEMTARIKDIPGLLEIESTMGKQNPEVNIKIDRDRTAALGLSVSEITDVVRRKVKGEAASRFDQGDQQLDIVVQLKAQDRDTVDSLKRIVIPGTAGDIRLDQVATIKPGLGPATITRAENSRVALIRANIHGRPLGDVVGDITAAMKNVILPGNCAYKITGQNEEMKRSLPSLYLAIALAIILVYILLASEFESLTHPFVIMFVVPFSMVGLALILLLSGQTLNIFTLLGILMMIGILDNVAIVMISAINQNRDAGLEKIEAIVEAGKTRMRPILISNLTTILGMVPMAVAWGPGTELSAPMAISVIGGLSSATVLTLLTIPCLYLVFDNLLPRSYHPQKPPETGEPAGPEACAPAGPAA